MTRPAARFRAFARLALAAIVVGVALGAGAWWLLWALTPRVNFGCVLPC